MKHGAPRFAIGLDFGTESARMLLVDVESGEEADEAVFSYPHGVLSEALPDGTPLPPDWALQHPRDWVEAAEALLERAHRSAGPGTVIGIGLDFTSCTMLPTHADGTPLCLIPRTGAQPHAWPKLWKHHAAQRQADRLNALRPAFLDLYGGRTSSEWLHAKSLQILDEAPSLFEAAGRIIEAGDWMVWQLTGREVRSACQAGYKAHWQQETGYPQAEVLAQLDPHFPSLLEKLDTPVPVGRRAGSLTPRWAARSGLPEGVPVAVAVIDAHAALPGLGVSRPGMLVMALGTSTCHLLLSARRVAIRGISGVVRDGILPGLYAYEAGQPATGDALEWWVRTLQWGMNGDASMGTGEESRRSLIFDRLERQAATIRPGPTGLIALDWWNGSRTPLVDADLSAVLAGLTIGTTPAEIYRAIIEATAFGTRQVVDILEQGHAVEPVTELRVCGGLTRSELLMQIYADVTGRTLYASPTPHASARGAAIYGALAAGHSGGGYDEAADALEHMGVRDFQTYRPNLDTHVAYETFYRFYRELHRHFGEGGTDLLRSLKAFRT